MIAQNKIACVEDWELSLIGFCMKHILGLGQMKDLQ